MKNVIAERNLLYSLKGCSTRRRFVIKVNMPYHVDESMDDFIYNLELYACTIEFNGLPETFTRKVFGADSVQVLQLATDIDGYVKGLEKIYDIFWPTGEPYFE